MSAIKVLIATAVVAATVDFLWIGVVMSGFYKTELGMLARRVGDSLKPDIPSAIAVYLAFACLIVFFVLPAIGASIAPASYLKVFLFGALFGFLTYCFYDFTNYSVLSVWSFKLAIIDIAWGTVLSGISVTFASWLTNVLR